MACSYDHDVVTTTYCPGCGKRVGYKRPADLLRHLTQCSEAAANLVRKDPTDRRKRDAEKWVAWADWVKAWMSKE